MLQPEIKSRKLNVGCGFVFHPDWENIDFMPTDPSVTDVNLYEGLPYGDSEFDVCYSAHVLEHFEAHQAKQLLAEIYRVLKPGGIVRIVVPDLEQVAVKYIGFLDQLKSGNAPSKDIEFKYDWMLLEMYDQFTRRESGGKMKAAILQADGQELEFMRSRISDEVDGLLARCGEESALKFFARLKRGLKKLLTLQGWKRAFQLLREEASGVVVFVLGGKRLQKEFKSAIFRSKGEIHLEMYDQFSLKRLMISIGFMGVSKCGPCESRIFQFERYELDAVNGQARKPDSLYMEGLK